MTLHGYPSGRHGVNDGAYPTMSSLSFFGAAGTVTGSCTLLDTGGRRCLVDCGLFQGNRHVRALNEQPFPFDAASVDCLLLTHAHTDHTGLVPKLIEAGFTGSIHATRATADLLGFMLEDSARIQASKTERDNRRRVREGKEPREPLYTLEHAREALARIEPLDYDQWVTPVEGIEARWWNAGHILGSASIELRCPEPEGGRTLRLMFSGDLGPEEKTFHAAPDAEQGFDYVICESTYGDRERADYTLGARRAALKEELVAALARGGNVVVPCFAVERSQELLHDIGVLLAEGAIPEATVYLDSPLARKVTEVFVRHMDALEDIELPAERLFADRRFRLVESVEESRAINEVQRGAIIVSASGMADAGRVVHHLKNNIWRPEATVLFVGYQAPGTTGAHIRSGADEVFLHGRKFRIAATIRSIGNYSAHADQSELIDWIVARRPIAGGLFLNHGDDEARATLSDLLVERGIERERIVHPAFDERFELDAGTPASKGRAAERIDPALLVPDGRGDHARFALALGKRLDELGSDIERRALIARLEAVLEEG